MESPIYILWLRQIKRYYRSRSRVLGSFGQPLLFLIALGFGFGPIFQKAGGGNYLEFLTPGIVSMAMLFTSVFSGIEVIWDKQFGFLKETLVAPVSRLEIMIGRTLGGATTAIIQGLIVFIMAIVFGFHPGASAIFLLVVLFMLFISVLFTAFGTALASGMEDMQGFQLIINFLVMPIFFLSGALFPLNDVPYSLYVTSLVNPLSYGVDGLRGALIGNFNFSLTLDVTVLFVVTFIMVVIGSWKFSKIEI